MEPEDGDTGRKTTQSPSKTTSLHLQNSSVSENQMPKGHEVLEN